MNRKPRTLLGETLRQSKKRVLLDDPITEVLDRMCSSPSSDSSVSISDPDPYKCQIPLERVTPRCRHFCKQTMSERAIQCQEHCRKYVLLTDTVTGLTYRGFSTLVRYLLAPAGYMLRVTLLVPLASRMALQMAAWPFLGLDPPHVIHDNWSTYSSPAPLDCAVEGITFSPLDRYDSVPGYRADAFWTLWNPLGKHANVYGELNLILQLRFPVAMQVGIPRGLNVKNPSTQLQLEYAQAGDMSQASRHPLVPRAFPWPAPTALHGPRRRSAPKLVRTPILNDLETRSGNVYEGEGPDTRKKRRTQ